MNKKILICDDDDGILELLEIMLEDSGYDIISEKNSLNVYDLIDAFKPDLLLLDLWMPVLSGDQILKNVRQNADTIALPVIIISASRDGKEIASTAGASAFVAKPFDIDNLLNKIHQFLN